MPHLHRKCRLLRKKKRSHSSSGTAPYHKNIMNKISFASFYHRQRRFWDLSDSGGDIILLLIIKVLGCSAQYP